ncbi:MAG: ATP-binding cassette domain-containing protein [Pseudonocardiaceae bacterium]|nr:ATP-binding cassette domain-containing protein [Pseudonocardiaceae bacterium]
MSALTVRNLNSYYGSSHILWNVAFDVEEGTSAVLLGRNGAGKTTSFKSIMNLGPSVRGRILLRGEDVTGVPPHRLARRGMGYVPEDRRIYAGFSVTENLRLGGFAFSSNGRPMEPDEVFDLFPLLKPLAARRGGQLSGGEQQLLAVARCLVGRPSVMLLDEPSEGLAPVIARNVLDALRSLRENTDFTLLLAEQNVSFAMNLATHVHVLEQGELVYSGTKEAFDADPALKTRYLSL